MPFKTTRVDPELFLTHAGVDVFHTYKDDDIDQGRKRFWFTTREFDDKGHFDVRELDSAHMLDQHPPYINASRTPEENLELQARWDRWHDVDEPAAIHAIIVASIDAGLITKPEEE
jgi:hypothetical protein